MNIQSDCLEDFLRKINPKPERPPEHYNIGNRKGQIQLCRLRVKNADLNENLWDRNLFITKTCSCGESDETTEHYLLHCSLYENERRTMFDSIYPYTDINTNILLQGSENLSNNENDKIILAVIDYILTTKRFK